MTAAGLHCELCKNRIGLYEPLWWRRPDGSITECGYLAVIIDPESVHPASRFYHHACLQPPPTAS